MWPVFALFSRSCCGSMFLVVCALWQHFAVLSVIQVVAIICFQIVIVRRPLSVAICNFKNMRYYKMTSFDINMAVMRCCNLDHLKLVTSYVALPASCMALVAFRRCMRHDACILFSFFKLFWTYSLSKCVAAFRSKVKIC
jgi:hypothetical protein